jgi:hypothetical protein
MKRNDREMISRVSEEKEVGIRGCGQREPTLVDHLQRVATILR